MRCDEWALEKGALAPGYQAAQLDQLAGVMLIGSVAAHRFQAVFDRRVQP